MVAWPHGRNITVTGMSGGGSLPHGGQEAEKKNTGRGQGKVQPLRMTPSDPLSL
jgi:hypothetical protein